MNCVDEGFHGTLDAGLRTRELLPALLQRPAFTDDELHLPLQFRHDETLPLVLSFFEYYRFLARLVDTVLTGRIATLVLVRVKMPAVLPLPPILLDERVAIFHDVAAESRALAALGRAHVCVDANFKLYAWSAGNNAFSVRWVSPAGHRLAPAALARIGAVVATLPARYHYCAAAPTFQD